MEQIEQNKRKYMAYDYKEVEVQEEKYSFFADSYECFGWEMDENVIGTERSNPYSPNTVHGNKRKLYLKRDRKIMNKAELTRLQRNFEACVQEVEALERSKTAKASIWALTVGVIGTAFMAGSVFAVTAATPKILLCVILAIPAFLGWITPYFLYKKMTAENMKKLLPLIEDKYDEIYELCEKGSKLLYPTLS